MHKKELTFDYLLTCCCFFLDSYPATITMNNDEIIFDNLLDTSVDGNVFLEDLIEDPGNNVLEQAMKENMVS